MKKPVACVVLPTYNEAENVKLVVPRIFEKSTKVSTHDIYVLVVDDNSPDGTQEVIRDLMQIYKSLHLIVGEKEGLGAAYIRGINHAIEQWNPELILQMDADGQHDAALIPLFVSLSHYGFSVIIGSRFTTGGELVNFSLRRRIISYTGNWMIRFLGGIPRIRDCTSAYRCIRADLLKQCDFSFLSTRGYSFLSSMLCELLRNGARVIEIPIIFAERPHGVSKLALRDQIEFLVNIARIRFRSSEDFFKYCAVGLSGASVNMGVYIVLTRIGDINFKIASPIAIAVSIFANFLFNQFLAFRKRTIHISFWRELTRFHIVTGLAGIINYGVFLSLVMTLSFNDIAANFTGIIIAIIANYSLTSLWAFRETNKNDDSKNP
jgi:dolichol-phosphate mannosyltransferase